MVKLYDNNLGKKKEGVVQQDNRIDQSISQRQRPVRFCDNGNCDNDGPTSCSMGMIGIMNQLFLYVGIKKKKQLGYRSWNGFDDTTSMDMCHIY